MSNTIKKASYMLDRVEYWSDWLLDGIACATQDRTLLRGEPDCNEFLLDAIKANAEKALENIAIEMIEHGASL